MKNKFGPIPQLIFGSLLVIGVIAVCMYLFFLPFWAISDQKATLVEFYFPDNPPEFVRNRSVKETNNLELLWIKEFELSSSYYSQVNIVISEQNTVHFWTPITESLISLDIITGTKLGELSIPNLAKMAEYNDVLYILSPVKSIHVLASETDRAANQFPSCVFGGNATVHAIDPRTGVILWNKTYVGGGYWEIIFNSDGIYLAGSADHNTSRSITEIDPETGAILYRDCYEYPEEKDILRPSNELDISVHSYHQITQNSLVLRNLSSIEFEGPDLHRWYVYSTIQGNAAIIYLEDSNQLIGLRLFE